MISIILSVLFVYILIFSKRKSQGIFWLFMTILGIITLTIGNYILYALFYEYDILTPQIAGILTTLIPLFGLIITIFSSYKTFRIILNES